MMLVYKNHNSQVITDLGKTFLIQKDYPNAIKCFEIAANNGSSDAILELAQMYMKGVGLELNKKKAKQYFKVLSNKYNSDVAQYQLGMIYNGERKYAKSKKYFELSADQDNTDALMKLGLIYRDGLGVKKNPNQTYQYFNKAAKLGEKNALFYLAVFCRDGFGTQKNINRARRYYKLGCIYGVNESYLNLGFYYANNDNLDLAKYYWGICDSPKAQYNLGIVYEEEKNYDEAKKMFEKAAKQNHSDSILAIGKLYINGFGVEENIDIGLEYIIKAARLNNNRAIQIINEVVDEFERYEDIHLTQKQLQAIKNYAF